MIGGLSAQLEAFNPQLFPADSQNELQDSLETPRHVRPCLLSDDDDGEEAPKKALNKLDRLVKRRQKTVIPVEIGSEDGIEENDCNSSDNEDDENGFKQDDFRSNSEDDVKNRKIKDTKKSTPPKSIKKPSKAQLESMLRESERLKRETIIPLVPTVREPKSLAGFFASFAEEKRKPKETDHSSARIQSKPWAKFLSAEELKKLSKESPKLVSPLDLATSTKENDLELILVDSSKNGVDRRRSIYKSNVVPKPKRSSIDCLNDRLNAKIAQQRKATTAQRRRRNADEAAPEAEDAEEEEILANFTKLSRKPIFHESSSSSSVGEEEQEEDLAEEEEFPENPYVYLSNKPALIDQGSLKEEQEQEDQEEEDLIHQLIDDSDKVSVHESDAFDDSLPNVRKKPIAQMDITQFLSGDFSKEAMVQSKKEAIVQSKTVAKIPQPSSILKFFDDEALDEDQEVGLSEDENGDRQNRKKPLKLHSDEEEVDEAAIAAELRDSNFIVEDDEEVVEEEDFNGKSDRLLNQQAIHRKLMMAEDDALLDRVLQRFAPDPDAFYAANSATFNRLHEKYEETAKPTTCVEKDQSDGKLTAFQWFLAQQREAKGPSGDDYEHQGGSEYEQPDSGEEGDGIENMKIHENHSDSHVMQERRFEWTRMKRPQAKANLNIIDSSRRTKLLMATEEATNNNENLRLQSSRLLIIKSK